MWCFETFTNTLSKNVSVLTGGFSSSTHWEKLTSADRACVRSQTIEVYRSASPAICLVETNTKQKKVKHPGFELVS